MTFSSQQKQNVVALSDILEEELLHGASTTPGGSSSDLPLSPDGTPDSALQDHALRQAKLSRELQGLNEMLEKKERLASQMLQNDDQMNTMRVQYEVCVIECRHVMASVSTCLQVENRHAIGIIPWVHIMLASMCHLMLICHQGCVI